MKEKFPMAKTVQIWPGKEQFTFIIGGIQIQAYSPLKENIQGI